MNIYKFFYWELNNFKSKLETHDLEIPIDQINIVDGYDRCMARVWDNKTWDINKRCINPIFNYEFCKIHNQNVASGRIDEYPAERDLLRLYRNKDKDIDNKINISHELFYISTADKITLKENNILYKPRMSIESITGDLIKIIKDLSLDENITLDEKKLLIKSYIIKKYDYKFTIGENEILMSKIDKYYTTPKININKTIKINIKRKSVVKEPMDNIIHEPKENIIHEPNSHVDSIIITDQNINKSELFIYNENNNQYLYTNKNKHCGIVREWTDYDDEVPCEYKTNDGIVLNPNNNLPILQYEINRMGSMFSGLNEGIYREYEYDDVLEVFRQNSNVSK